MMHHWIWAGAVGLLVGWLAALLSKKKGWRLAGDLALGLLGGVLGRFVARWLHPGLEAFWPLLGAAALGAAVLPVFWRLLRTA